MISGPFGSDIGARFFKREGVPVIRGNNLSTDHRKFIDNGFVFITEEKADDLNAYAIEGDLLFTAAGTIGQVGMIPKASLFERYVISNKQIRFRADPKKADLNYLYAWLSSPWILKAIIDRDTGSTVPLINLSVVRSLPVSLPKNISTQWKIGHIFRTIDAKIELNNHVNAELEALAKTIYDYWFVQFDFPGANGHPYKSSGGAMVWNHALKREIPVGWESAPLGKWLSFQRGISYRASEIKGNGTPLINLNSFRLNGSIKLNGTKRFSGDFRENQRVHPGDLVIAITDVTRNADITGRAFVVPDLFGESPLISCDVAAVHAEPHLSAYYLEQLFNSAHYHNYLKPFSSGTLVLHLNLDGVRWFESFLPPQPLLERYDAIAKAIRDQINANLAQNVELTQLRDWLLPLLMNGQVRVA